MAKNNFAHLRQEHSRTPHNTVPATAPFAHLVNGASTSTAGLTPTASAIIAMAERIEAAAKEVGHG